MRFLGDEELQAESAHLMAERCGWPLTETEKFRVSQLLKRQVTVLLCLERFGLDHEIAANIGRRAGMPWLIKGKV